MTVTYESAGDKAYSLAMVVVGAFSIPATTFEVGGTVNTIEAMGRITDTWVSLSDAGDLLTFAKVYLSKKARAQNAPACIALSTTAVDPTGAFLTITETVHGPPSVKGAEPTAFECKTHFRRK